MAVFAIGDLHLSKAVQKPMDIFGRHWDNHWEKIKDSWTTVVAQDDVVLIPGDISWAMTLDDALPDLMDIGLLPGKKILIRGNHDYWWSSITKVRASLPDSIYALQNDSIKINDLVFCGTRGWLPPGVKDFNDHDMKIYDRELIRLQLSMEHGKKAGDNLVVLLHYPPFGERNSVTPMVELIGEYKPSHVVYGHLHGDSTRDIEDITYKNTKFHLVSCDYLDFKLKTIIP